jgi:transketolase
MPDFDPRALRKTVVQMAYAGSTVHIACAFSIVEILAVLYRNHLRYPNDDPNAADRDYLVLSKGHGVMAQYACLHEKGWLPKSDLENYFGDGSRLKGLSDAHVTGCEVTSGSLGHGLPVGVGMALAAKLNKTDQYCYVVVGDGEMNEGPMWEAMLFASHRALDNLIVIVDENGFQAMGKTAEVLNLGNLQEKFAAFGFETASVNGHDELELDDTLSRMKQNKNGVPKAIVARTVKGKGVSFMEGSNLWHYTRLSENTFKQAMSELEL